MIIQMLINAYNAATYIYQTISPSNVRRSSRILVWRVIRFDRPILPVSYNSIDKLIGQVTALCHPTDFQTGRVLRSV